MNALVEELGIEVRHFVATVHSFPDAHLKKELDVRYVNKFLGLLAAEIWCRLFITNEIKSDATLN